ncbi:MAG: hypothetical protein ACI8QF_003180 [Limisphaerales bacterium]|jgi:hypothetical protein
MNPRIKKELRENLPAPLLLSAAMAMAMLAGSTGQFDTDLFQAIVVMALILGSGFLGAAPLAREFSENSAGLLLAQPVSRTRIWFEKLCISGGCWMALLLAFWIFASFAFTGPDQSQVLWISTWAAFAIFAAGPLVAVLCRSPLPSVLLASGSPFPVIIALAILHDEVRTQPTCILVGIEGVAAIIAGYRMFLRYEDKPSFMNLSIRIPLPKAARSAGNAAGRGSFANRPMRALAAKELRVIQPILIASAGMALAITLIHLTESLKGDVLGGLTQLFWIIQLTVVPAVIGITGIMSDRSPGVREHQMTFPVSIRAQWNIKLIVCLSATAFVVVALILAPMILISSRAFPASFEFGQVSIFLSYGWLVALVSMYAATLSQTTVRALSLTLVFMIISACLYGVVVFDWITRVSNTVLNGQAYHVIAWLYLSWISAVTLIVLGRLGYINMRHLRTPRESVLQVASLALALTVIVAVIGKFLIVPV